MAQDVMRVGDIWLEASIRAHHFVPEEFWRADHRVMTTEILPQATGHVHVTGGVIDDFITLGPEDVHCLFVHVMRQSRGIGSSLLTHAKGTRNRIRLAVYTQNEPAPSVLRIERFHGNRSGNLRPHRM